MRESLVLNFEVLKNLDISVEECVFLYFLTIGKEYLIEGVDLNKLQKQKLIKIITNEKIVEYHLREKAVELIDFLTIEVSDSLEPSKGTYTKSKRAIDREINGKIEEFRNKWRGLRAGSMGSHKSCVLKLTRWMKENPEFNFKQILKAVDIYINSLNGDYRFLQRADYFIFKQENNREESSRLSAYVDELGITSNEEWTSTLK